MLAAVFMPDQPPKQPAHTRNAVVPTLPGHWRCPLQGAEACGSKPACAGLDRPKSLRLWRKHQA
jgi:hypothetical protein